MCFGGSSPAIPQPAPAPAAPEAVPESVAPADTATTNSKDTVKIKRKGTSTYRTDLNIPSAGTGGGLNVPR